MNPAYAVLILIALLGAARICEMWSESMREVPDEPPASGGDAVPEPGAMPRGLVHLLVILGIVLVSVIVNLGLELAPWWASIAVIVLAALASLFDRSDTATRRDTPVETEPSPEPDLTTGG